jgi:prolyl-tRNA editing enzyme YbaK/EbsC (Cys-tRNA(Pro) deacylase)
LVIFSGNVSPTTEGCFAGKSEAAAFAEVAERHGVPRSAMLLEERATNTGENITLSLKLLSERGLTPRSFILVQKPFMLRRSYATAIAQSGGAMRGDNLQTSSPELDPRSDAYAGSLRRTIEMAVGALHRTAVYPSLGFQAFQFVPRHVWAALGALVRAGFGGRLIAGSPLADEPPQPRSLDERVAALEDAAREVQFEDRSSQSAPDNVPAVRAAVPLALTVREERVRAAVLGALLLGCGLVRVPANYYERPLAERASLLRADPRSLCKTVLFETDGDAVGDTSEPLARQRYVGVIVPYLARLRLDVLAKALAGGMRLAADGAGVTGFEFGGVTPFGSAQRMAVVVSKQCCELSAIWLGGGEVGTKLRVPVRQLLKLGGVAVMDVAATREAEDD